MKSIPQVGQHPIAVIARTFMQFREYVAYMRAPDRCSEVEYIYADSPHHVRGKRFSGVVLVGDYWKRPDWHEIEDEVKTRLLPEVG